MAATGFNHMRPPCKDCKRRTVGCHNEGNCPEWDEWNRQNIERREAIAKETRDEKAFDFFMYQNRQKMHDRGASIRKARKQKGIRR